MSAVDDWRTGGAGFAGSFVDSTDQTVVLLRGDVDVATVNRLREHVAGLLTGGTRFIVVDVRAAERCDESLLDFLSRTQRRLGRRHGMLRVVGLHPALLTAPEATA